MDRLRIWGLLGTVAIHGGVVAAILGFSSSGDAATDGPKLSDMVTIEAALAYKAKQPEPSRQPQKPRRQVAPPPAAQPTKVSRDETQAPVTKPPEPPPPSPPQTPSKPTRTPSDTPVAEPAEEDFAAQFEKYREMRQTGAEEQFDDTAATGTDADRGGGAFDGSEHGFAEVNKGDPYMRDLAGDANRFWVVPTLERDSGTAIGCVQIGEDGRILANKLFPPTSNATVDAAVKRALRKLTELRADGSKPVPANLIKVTTEWLCFKFPY